MNECPACTYHMDSLQGICPECGSDITKLSQRISHKFGAWKKTNVSLKIIRGIYLAMILIMLFGWGMDILYMAGSWVFRSNSSFYEGVSWLVTTSLGITELGILIGMIVASLLLPIAPFRNGPISHRMVLALRFLILMEVAQFVGRTLFPEQYFNMLTNGIGRFIDPFIVMGLQWTPWILIVLILMQISTAFESPNLHRRFKMMMIFLIAQIPYQLLMNIFHVSSTFRRMFGLSEEAFIWNELSAGMVIFIQTGNILSMIAAFVYVLMGWIFIGQLGHSIGLVLTITPPASSLPSKTPAE